ncbi:non-ribosomal peptide synthase/polyketide synthase [Pseudomonas sichuanensis]|uniref:non-ribosomal peptide synthase/polyketide synthase n=1 Tax=Pseudomonas sichuanensis TaxID=2213015 RepID=UPI00244C8616|nr:non-ribosomal peptide synthase/polyketide synthase [Pseudomonas sichuanensis]MDH0732055.1 non-ribosomal peptide synthase/polyketide synthase [Pseudomonas sichuanensis]MDH1584861.1 non-ribosomal peptide synthase/polyketide synthase [Pseudomonas sichuanensis]MDH1593456.1 non-ribosomal peptide synthase/polyketide synthase [Pseudomonas sichuanensis]MDH1599155.1 non-ribosomal peptide synthase/polyketide synthase [Pseudomonas sichuanensis]
MLFSELMAALSTRAIRLQREDQDLIVLGDDETLDDTLWEALSRHKPALLEMLAERDDDWLSPAFQITPDMLPLVQLDQQAIDRIVASVPGGAANVQDIYPLAPLQQGMLYQHLAASNGDPYLAQVQLRFTSKAHLEAFAEALQWVIQRHDILRTALHWEYLDEPVQVVWREATLVREAVAVDGSQALARLCERFDPRHYRLDLSQAPLMQLMHAREEGGAWVALLMFHHLVMDHTALDIVRREIQAHLAGESAQLAAPMPFRNVLAAARLALDEQAHERFFRDMLADLDEPTLAFGLQDKGDQALEQARLTLPAALSQRLRSQARSLGVSPASVLHLGFARLVGQLSARQTVVFGSVLLGRMTTGDGSEQALGMFINTLPLRIDLGQHGVRDALLATHRRLSALLGHEQASLALAQRCSGVAAPAPLFNSMLNYRHSAAGDAAEVIPVAPGIDIVGAEERTDYPLTVSVDDLGDDLRLTVQSLPQWGATRLCGQFEQVLDALVEALETNPVAPLQGLAVLPALERDQVLRQFNDTAQHYAQGQTVHALVEAQAQRTPDAPALIQAGQVLSYGELNRRANQLAHRLIGLGAKLGDRVALCLPRNAERLVGLLAVLKAGAAYVPVDPTYPAERIAYLLADSAPALVLATAAIENLPDMPRLNLDQPHAFGGDETNPALPGLDAQQLAYLVYTSGSTGQPKGVMIEHHTLANLVHWHCQAFDLAAGVHSASVAGFGFDAMAWEVWPTLCAGATLHLPPETIGNEHVDELLDWWLQQPLQVSFLPTPVAEQALRRDRQHPTLRTLLIGGDRLRQFERDPGFAVVNNYGPTETTVVATSGQLVPGGALHIGRPIANTQVYVLDEGLQPVPVGVTGELFIGGAQVARGYFNRPELTEARFLPDPFSAVANARLYRSGDLVRWNPDGTLDYLGRNDDQVKIRGVRVELGEIEAALAAQPGIADAVVLVREARLLAWFTETAPVDLERLRQALQASLPAQLVPLAFMRLDELPLTSHGKLDRRALPDPDSTLLAGQAYEAPQSATEVAMAAIWAEVLGVERVGRHDNFFELGGHSLLAVTLVERLRKAGLVIDVRVLFAQPTLATLASAAGIGHETKVPANRVPYGAERITPDLLSLIELDQAAIDAVVATVPGGAANVQEIYPLAPLQEGILYHHLSAEQGDPYLLQTRLAFDSVERLLAWAGALQQVIDRHDILRTSVLWQGLAQPLQVVWRTAELVVGEIDDLVDEPGVERIEQLHARFDARHHRLDLAQAPLTRLYYSPDPGNQQVVAILLFHHLTLDHTAMDVVAREMRALLFGQADTLPAPVPYRNYVAQARLADPAGHEAFFREMLADVEEPTLPLGFADVQGDGRGIETAFAALDADISQRLRGQARQLGVSAASLMHLAWARVLGVLANRHDVVFGTVLMGRLQGGEGADRALGMFINTLPLRVDTRASAQAAVRATHRSLSALLGHEHAPLALAQRCSGVAASAPLFSALLNYRHSAADAPREGEGIWEGVRLLGGEERSNYPLTLSVNDLGEGFSFSVLAVEGIGAGRVVEWMVAAVGQLLQALEQGQATPVDSLPILSDEARQQLLGGFNDTAREYPQGQTVHALVEAQAARTPDATALTQAGVTLSYGELNLRANRLAHRLIARGVQRGDRVALCLPRSLERVISLLAVLKAGAAYVPVDPSYPAERIAYLLSDSAPALLLAESSLGGLPGDVPRLDLDAAAAWHSSDSNPQVTGLDAQALAYVVYTSGSTGLPKGVMIEHQTLANLVHWHCQAFALRTGERTSSVAGFGFDAMAWEVWPALCAGATLHLPPAPIGNEHVDELLDWWLQQPLTVSFLPTPVAEQALRRERQHPTLRTLLIGGDRLRQFDRDPGFDLVNNYGPTETTVVATSGKVLPGAALHIGQPIANTRVYVLDEHRQPVPIGVTGELYIGGAQIARGYFNRPELTAERFLDDPFSRKPGARMYRSGDLVRWNADGTLDYLGRNDDQVKVRGVRVELGEIEAALQAQPGIDDAVVLVRDERLLAWFTETAPVQLDSLRQALQVSLPAHMLPQALIRLAQLPLTSHGKLDRRALPEPDTADLISHGYAAPQGQTETIMAAIWAEVLGVERVGRHDNFFELGGHSLLAVTLIERLRQQGLQTDVRVLFGQPTVAALAAALGNARLVTVPENRIPVGCTQITPDMLPLIELDPASIARIVATVPGGAANVQDIYPLAPLQEGILYHHLSAAGADPYLLQWRIAFDCPARLQAFASALDKVIARHDVLRTAVLWDGLRQPVQVVWRNASLAIIESAADPVGAGLAREESTAMLELCTAPLIRLLHNPPADNQRLEATLQFHHIVLDHTAMKVVLEEIRDHLRDQAPTQPPVPYRNYVAQARLAISEAEHEAFFHAELADITEPTLPYGLTDIQAQAADFDLATVQLGAADYQRLRRQAQQLGVSAASLLHLAWARLVSATSGKDSVVFGTVLLGRLQGGAGADRGLGMFINTLPLRLDLDGLGVRDGVRLAHQRLSSLLVHEHASLALAQRCSGVVAPLPLFSAVLNYRHGASAAQQQVQREALEGIEALPSGGHGHYPLSVNVDDLGDGLRMTAQVTAQVGAQRVCEQLLQVLVGMLDALEQQPQLPLQQLPVLAAQERQQLLVEANATTLQHDLPPPLHRLFEAQVHVAPDALALVAEEGQLSYRQLDEQANRLAHHLIGLGVKPDDRVAICVERGLSLVVGLLAILKAGGAYVPVDPGYPAERIRHMLEDSAPLAVLVHGATREVVQSSQAPLIDLDASAWDTQPISNPRVPGLASHHLAYVIYTSGSTGLPKGVMVEHRNVVNLVHWSQRLCAVVADASVLHKTPVSFDASVWELFWPLCSGLRLVLARPDGQRDPHYLAQLIQAQRVNVVQFVPALLQQFLEHPQSADCSSLSDIVCGGGELTQALAARVRQQLPGVRLHNVYGPTETTVDCSVWTLEPDAPLPEGVLPIGRPIDNTQLYVLDSRDQPVPWGVTGHLHIGGAGVSRGYLGLGQQQAERFIASPFVAGARLYRSGDLVRQRADGNLEFLGRNDQQVKIRGLRIEPGEIEACLTRVAAVREAVVLAFDERLVAYYTGAEQPADGLRQALLAQMPEYMVPGLYIHLDSLPLAPNGKLDRKALPAPDATLQQRPYEAPQGRTEALLAGLWAELLGVEQVGRHDNFFALGGHSLLAVSLTARLRLEGLQVDVRTLFGQPTLAALAATLGQNQQVEVPENRIPADCTHITPALLSLIDLDQAAIDRIVASVPGGAANVQDIYPLAPLQEGILYHHLSAAEHDPYVLYSRLRFDSLERLQAFASALDQVIARHDVLRTAVLWDGLPQPVQVVWRQAPLAIVEQVAAPREASAAKLDLSSAPLLRLLYTPSAGAIDATLQFHHIVLDHTALEVIGEELVAFMQGNPAPTHPAAPYRNYVAQARLGISQAEHEGFFRSQLADIDEPTLPFGLSDVQGDGRGMQEAKLPLSATLAAGLRRQAQGLGISVASLFHLAWARLLAAASGKDSVVFGTVLLGRLQGGEGAERALGMFINTLPLRVDLGGVSLRAAAHATHQRLSALLAHEHASLALAQRCSGVAAPLPLFSAMLNYRHGAQSSTEQRQAWQGIEVLEGQERTNYPLSLNVDDLGDGFRLVAMTPADIGAARICGQMNQVLEAIVAALEHEPELPLQRLPVLEADERQRVLVDFNATAVDYNLEQTLHGLIEAQVERTPDAVAVRAEEGSLSYRQLNEQANRLAHHLIGLGVKPDDRVAICVERGLSMVVGLLAILKASGAYVPVDPDYPAERVRHMLSDSAPVAVLVHAATRHVPESGRVIDLDQPSWDAQPASNPIVKTLTPHHLAYVIYTSGSTGLPKGVMNEHAGVVNRLLWTQDAYDLGVDDVVLQKTPFSFDVSVWEFLWPLQTGARLVMARPGGHRDPEYLREVIRREGVTTLHFVPSMLDVYLAHGEASADCLKRVLCSGEALPGSLVRRFHAQLPTVELHNLYGPTEAAVDVSAWQCVAAPDNTPIGKPIANTALYVLDGQGQPVPQGVAGELFIGGVQVARGYLNRAELTAERFIDDPFSTRIGARLYRTGDLARHLPDGNIEYLGRNDDQVKIRGLRIELGEIQAGLTAIAGIKEAVVVARDQRLVAYYTGEAQSTETLRSALLTHLPEFMVPALFMQLEALPLSPNGKLDRKALPQPDAIQDRPYEAPQGETETLLAAIWAELLGVARVGRHDNFFELGGHSLLAVTLTSRLRQQGLHADIRVLFGQPTLAALAAAVSGETGLKVPANRIPAQCTHITPAMLPLADLSQASLDTLMAQVPGGACNIQDIYGLAPLQQGILYHHLASEGADPYVLQARFAFPDQGSLDAFAAALDQVIARHDILRTSIHWQHLEEPVQVVWRKVSSVGAGLPREGKTAVLELGTAPLIRLRPTTGIDGRIEATLLIHHIILDHAAVEHLVAEVTAVLHNQPLPHASVPYRNYVAQARLGGDSQAEEVLFRELLGDIDEPTEVFGLRSAHSDGSRVLDSRQALDANLARRLREQARQLGISVASLVHQAWGQVLAQLSGRQDVVFGTVLLGRLQSGEGAERALGMFINTLPLRVSVGAVGAADGVRLTHQRLARLLAHEHASLAVAQRCSGVPATQALFTSLLNYRHSAPAKAELREAWQGIEQLSAHERSNYPLVVNVDDLGDAFVLTVQAVPEVDGEQVCRLLGTALEQLTNALEHSPATALQQVSCLAPAERELVLHGFNTTRRDYPREHAVHTLFAAVAALSPDALAVIHGEQRCSYQQLDQRANRLAHHLLALDVRPGDRVALLLPRSVDLLAAQLAVSKCAAVYVPLDSNAPFERQAFMVADSQAKVLLTHSSEPQLGQAQRVELDLQDLAGYPQQSPDLVVNPGSAAYIMYTSGSTGTPKGVQVPHRAIVRLVINNGFATFDSQDRIAFASNPAFDASTLEVWAPLLNGGTVVVIDQHQVLSREALRTVLLEQRVSVLWLTAGLFHQFAGDLLPALAKLRYLMVGGDVLDPAVIARVLREGAPAHLLNGYGPTEATTFSTTHEIIEVGEGSIPIGKPIGNGRCYVLDARQQPLPVGAVGELYIGGDGVAIGYLGQPALTAERFLDDPFSREPGALMYRSGDQVCWQADGTLRYLGRADQQIKLRGFRIELGEIEACLGNCTGVRDSAVVLREDTPGDKRLVAYFTATEPAPAIAELHGRLQAQLPDYMLPAAYVRLDALPLTANGKLDRRGLPLPGSDAVLSRAFEAPQGEVERTLAAIWADALKVGQVGRHDHFFELGGHSLLAVTLIERMRKAGLSADVRVLFAQPTLAALAAAVGSGCEVQVPANRVPHDARQITPAMLSLIDLDQASIDHIVASVPGGAANIQEIYPLAPLQEGILYHHLSAEQGDPYLLQSRLAFDSLARLHAWAGALQQVIDRHDILRTSVVTEGLEQPVQVVWREARMAVTAITDLTGASPIDALQARFDARHQRLDLSRAPLMRLVHADDPANQRVVAILQFHHLALDHTAMAVIADEMQALLAGNGEKLAAPVPYRTYVAQARLGADDAGHEAFFRDMLGDLDAPTLPFGLTDVQGDGRAIEEAHLPLDAGVARQLREQARRLGVSAASLAHLAWARVLGVLANRSDVVFGTVLMGRLQGGEGADRALGVFINTLPLRIDLAAPVLQAVQVTHQRLSALLGHEHASLALAQRCSGVSAALPLFSALFNYRHSSAGTPAQDDASVQGVRLLGGEERSNYPLTLSVDDLGEGFTLSVLAQEGIGAERVAQWMSQALSQLSRALAQGADTCVDRLSILDEAARQQVLEGFNASTRRYPQGQTVHALVEAQAACASEAAALMQDGQVLSYGELNRNANRLAHYLIRRGVQLGDRVALCLPRSLERLVGLLAVLKAGAAYVPVDPGYPAERIAYLLQDSAPALVLADATTRGLLGDTPRVELDRDDWQGETDSNPHVAGLDDQQLAYVIYTSGSTGQPKGVMVEHATLANLVHWHCAAFDLAAGSHTSTVAGFGFDAVAWEVWPALSSGAVLHLPPARIAGEHVDELLDWWLAQPLQVSFLPTPVAEQALRRERQHPTLRTLLVGGDRLRQYDREPGFTLVNNYGPTETTVVATSGQLQPGGALHIGQPIANTRVYVLDEHRQPVPVGAVGELYIGGSGVARGYLSRPELTEERFLADPFSANHDGRMYRSGDLVRWNADGTLDYLGRNDDQVKIRGVRVELGEIEAVLTAQQGIEDAVVLVRDERLLAWFTGAAPLEALREALQASLPSHLVPLAFIQLDALPLTSHGKLDRNALPDPSPELVCSQAYVAPQGAVENALALAWAEMLGVAQVGRHDNFFELGGHSLLAVNLTARLRRDGLQVDVRTLFGQPTIAALAATLGKARHVEVPDNLIPVGCTHITPDMLPLVALQPTAIERIVAKVPGGVANVQDIYPLAPLQEGILYHHLSAAEHDPYVLQSRFAFASREHLDNFAAALNKVIARHDVLRTAILWEGLPQPVQVVWRKAPLGVYEGMASHSLDLSQAPLLRLIYTQTGQAIEATLQFHHIVLDHTAMEVVGEELIGYLQGDTEPAHAPVPYRNYVAQARLGVSQAEHEAFFRSQLGDIDEPTLPFGLSNVQGDGRDIEEAQLWLRDDLAQRLRQQARQLGISVASLFHLAWARLLAAASGRDSVVFGTVLLGRLQGGEGAERALGMFINTLPLRIDLAGIGLREGAQATHQRLSALLAHEHASLALAQRCSGVAAPLPLFSAMLNYRHSTQVSASQRKATEGIDNLESQERSNYPLGLNVDDLGDGFRLVAMTPADIGAARICGQMNRVLEAMVAALEHEPELAVQRLPVLDADERQRVLVGFNGTAVNYNLEQTLHGLIEAQVERTPDAVAVRAEEGALSYRQLNEQANRLAHHLIALGVKPDDRVAICIERGLSMVVGLLAILKAGGAYVPVDPDYPAERVRHMLSDSAPVAVLVHAATRHVPESGRVIDLDQPSWDAQPASNPVMKPLTPHHLAYVIYTSGSTGLPKGVMNEHAGVVNRLLWMQDAYNLGADDVVLQKTPFSFDVSVWEFLWPLQTGARLVMARPGGHRDPEYLREVIRRESVTTLHFVPSMLDVYLAHGEATADHLKRVLCSGEALPGSLVRRFQAQLPNVELHNLYGPTEAAVDVSAWHCVTAPDNTPIGKPIANTTLYVLDGQGQPVPQGVAGELFIGGVQVARGYLNRAELTAERFIDDPFSTRPGARLYRTGDLARQLPDGNIEYLGRNDDQVKIRGLRIELGEIQAGLTAIAGIKEAVVVARDQRLVAYYTGEAQSTETLRSALLTHLPEFMVPALFMHLEDLPLSPNGKLDRKALPEPDAIQDRAYEAPEGETETLLAAIWAELLGVERVGRHDNFFELGGHSLLAVTLTSRLREQGLEADVRALFEQPTLAGYAAITDSMEIVL